MRHSIRYRLVAGTVAALLFGPGMATPAFAMGRQVIQRTQPVSITHLDQHHAVALESSHNRFVYESTDLNNDWPGGPARRFFGSGTDVFGQQGSASSTGNNLGFNNNNAGTGVPGNLTGGSDFSGTGLLGNSRGGNGGQGGAGGNANGGLNGGTGGSGGNGGNAGTGNIGLGNGNAGNGGNGAANGNVNGGNGGNGGFGNVGVGNGNGGSGTNGGNGSIGVGNNANGSIGVGNTKNGAIGAGGIGIQGNGSIGLAITVSLVTAGASSRASVLAPSGTMPASHEQPAVMCPLITTIKIGNSPAPPCPPLPRIPLPPCPSDEITPALACPPLEMIPNGPAWQAYFLARLEGDQARPLRMAKAAAAARFSQAVLLKMCVR